MNGHSLKPIEAAVDYYETRSTLEEFADAERPVPPPEFLKMFVGERPRARRIGRIAKVVGFGLLVVLLVLVWRFTPLAAMTHPAAIREWFAGSPTRRALRRSCSESLLSPDCWYSQ